MREVFEFVEGLCELTIERDEAAMPAFDLPPRSTEIAGDEEPEAFAAAPEMDDTVPEATARRRGRPTWRPPPTPRPTWCR